MEDAQADRAPRVHMPALDGIRGIAILMVLIHHYSYVFEQSNPNGLGPRITAFFELGIYGVDLFFTLSGFLITGILLDSLRSGSYFKTFYARRTLRIFPLYFLYLFAVLVVLRAAMVARLGDDPWRNVDPWWYLTYLANWKPDHGMHDPLLGHMWTLAVEEQFYIVWPLVVFLCPGRWLGRVCLLLALFALSIRVGMIRLGYDYEAVYRLTPPRMDTLVLGGFLSVIIRDDAARARMKHALIAITLLVFLGLIAIACYCGGFDRRQPLVMTFGWTLTAALSGVLVFWGASSKGQFVHLLHLSFLRTIGKYSYGIYVLHFLPLMIFQRFVGWRLFPLQLNMISIVIVDAATIVFLMASTIGLAWLSWRIVESPFLRWKSHFPYKPSAEIESGKPTLEGMVPSDVN